MNGPKKDLRGIRRAAQLLARPFGSRAAAKLSDAIDRQLAQADPANDPAVEALLKIGAGHAMPPMQADRSWALLERALFGTPAARPAISIPFRRPVFMSAFRALARRPALLAAACGLALMALVGAWRGPYLSAVPLRQRMVSAWARVRSYDADVQFVSFVPGYQIQWSGQVQCKTPDRERLQYDVLGFPVTIISRDQAGVIDSRLGGVNARGVGRLRFLSRMLRTDELVDMVTHAASVRLEGRDRLLGEPCAVLFFVTPGGAGEAPWDENPMERSLPRRVVSGRVWISSNTFLPEQVEMYSPGGQVAFSYRFTRLAVNTPLDSRLFKIPRRGQAPERLSLRRVIIPLKIAGD